KRPPPPVLNDVIAGDIDGVIALGPAQLVGLARQRSGPVERLGHIDNAAGLEIIRGLVIWLAERQKRLLGGLFLFRLFVHFKNSAGHLVGAIGGATLAALLISLQINILEILEADIFRAIDGLRDGTVDIVLHGGLHAHMIGRR